MQRNPFNFGDLALDTTFTDRANELAELEADIRNGLNVVIFAPRRYGKTSLVLRAAQDLSTDGILIAQVDLMQTATKEQLAAKLAAAIPGRLRALTALRQEYGARSMASMQEEIPLICPTLPSGWPARNDPHRQRRR